MNRLGSYVYHREGTPFSGKFFCIPHSTENALEKYRYKHKLDELKHAEKRKVSQIIENIISIKKRLQGPFFKIRFCKSLQDELRHHAVNEWGGGGPRQAPDLASTKALDKKKKSAESKDTTKANPSTKEPPPKNHLRSLNTAARERLGLGGRSLHDMRGTTPER